MDRLEHLGQLYLGARCNGENILVEVCGTALVLGLREHFTHGFRHTKTLVANHQLDPIQATTAQPLEEIDSAGLILFHTPGGTKNLTVAILVHRDSHQNSYIFKLSAPVATQINLVHIDMRVAPTLQRTAPPILLEVCIIFEMDSYHSPQAVLEDYIAVV